MFGIVWGEKTQYLLCLGLQGRELNNNNSYVCDCRGRENTILALFGIAVEIIK